MKEPDFCPQRREFLKLTSLLPFTLALTGSGLFLSQSKESIRENSILSWEEITQEKARAIARPFLKKIYEIGENPTKYGIYKEDFKLFQKMVNSTYPGISLTYHKNPFIEKIRGMKLSEATLAVIAALDVTRSTRYNEVPACNIYTLDILRALLGNEVIGDRYYPKNNHQPVSLGIKDIDWSNYKEVESYTQEYPAVHSNMIDWWMKNYGKNLGWKPLPPSQPPYSFPPNAIAVFCTSQEIVERNIANNPNFLGHMGVMFHPDPTQPSIIARTQATTNIPFEVLYPKHPVIENIKTGTYRVYYHLYQVN
jgi:hypothetical protein